MMMDRAFEKRARYYKLLSEEREDKIILLQSKLKIYEDALGVYANKNNWDKCEVGVMTKYCYGFKDGWDKAQTALDAVAKIRGDGK